MPSVPAPLLFFGKNRNSDGRERCSTTVPLMLRATTAHLLSFFHVNVVVGPCPVFIKVGCRRQEPDRWETPHSATRRGRRGYFACRAMLVGIRSRRSASLPTTRGRANSCTLAKTDCGVARYSGRRSHIGLCQNCVCEASAFQRRTPTRRPRQARPSRSHPGGRDKRGPPVSHR